MPVVANHRKVLRGRGELFIETLAQRLDVVVAAFLADEVELDDVELEQAGAQRPWESPRCPCADR